MPPESQLHNFIGNFGKANIMADQKMLVVPMLGDFLATNVNSAEGMGQVFAHLFYPLTTSKIGCTLIKPFVCAAFTFRSNRLPN